MNITLPEAAEKIRAANKIILTAHIIPDGDAIGAVLAMYFALTSIGKEVFCFIDDTIRKNLLEMPSAEKIQRPSDGEKISADLLVVLDTSPDRIGKVKGITDAPILNIDHHVTNKGGDFDLYVEPSAAATCEIVFKLLQELDVKVTREIAVCLYTGMATDTGFFNYSNTTPMTLFTAAELVEAGVKPNEIAEQMEKKTFGDLKGLNAALQTTKLFFDGKVIGMFVARKYAKTLNTTEGFIDLIRVVDGADVAFLLTDKDENFCRVSMRSKGVDVSAIAKRLGGGGHVRAAGCTINKNMEEAKDILIKAIGEYMIEEGWLLPEEFLEDKETALDDFEYSESN